MKLPSPYKISEIASFLGTTFIGNENAIVTGVNEIHNIQKGDLTFADSSKHYERALFSSASAIIINTTPENTNGKNLILSDDPFRDYNKFVKQFLNFNQSNQAISPTAKIGLNTIIQPNVFIGDNVIIGDHCIIHSNVSIYHNCIIGSNVIIHSNTVVGADAFYYKRKEEGLEKLESCGNVVIKDFVEIGANCTVDRGVSSNTIIGEGTKLDNLIQIGHDTVIGRNCMFASQVGVASGVTVEDDVILWGQVGIQKDITIGKGAVVLGQSGVPKSLEGDKTYFGSPATEAREKMKEIAYLKQIPVLIKILTEKL